MPRLAGKRGKDETNAAEKMVKATNKPAAGARGGITAPVTPSAELAAIVRKADLPRSEVVSKMRAYFKEHNLQDASDRRQIIADDKLAKIFGKKSVSMAVAPLDREGGQAQFIRHEEPGSTTSLAPVLDWMRENAHLRLSIDDLARRTATSPRTFARRFREQIGTTPLQWLITARVRRAQELLETTNLSLDRIAASAGFDSASALRDRFRQALGVSPTAYRRSLGLPVEQMPETMGPSV